MNQSHALLPLTMVGHSRPVRLVKIIAGRKLVRRLTELGLTPGVCFEIVHDHGGSLLLAVRNSRWRLGAG